MCFYYLNYILLYLSYFSSWETWRNLNIFVCIFCEVLNRPRFLSFMVYQEFHGPGFCVKTLAPGSGWVGFLLGSVSLLFFTGDKQTRGNNKNFWKSTKIYNKNPQLAVWNIKHVNFRVVSNLPCEWIHKDTSSDIRGLVS